MQADLFLFFPEWQGSGPTREIQAGAWRLRRGCPSMPFREVPVGTGPISGLRHGLLGYDTLLEQQQAAHRLIEEANPDRLFSLGGDCGIELAPVSWLNRKYQGKLAVIWLDAHGDLNSPDSSPSKHFHGMPLRFLLEEDPHPFSAVSFSRLKPSQVVLAGTRDLDPPESHFIQESGIPVFGVKALEADPALLSRQVLTQGLREVYLHIDLDVLEPSQFPQVKCPAPEGLSLKTLRSVIQGLKADCHVVGGSILEFVDGPADASLHTALDLIHETTRGWLSR